MRLIDESRGTGRTTRMLDAAWAAAEQGAYVAIATANHQECVRLYGLLLERGAEPTNLDTAKVYLRKGDAANQSLRLGEISMLCPRMQGFDPRTGRLDGAHPNVKTFADHYWVEQEMGWALEQWLM